MKAMIDKCDYIVGVSEHSGYAARIFFPEFDISKIKVYYSPAKYVVPVEGIEKIQREKYVLMLLIHHGWHMMTKIVIVELR